MKSNKAYLAVLHDLTSQRDELNKAISFLEKQVTGFESIQKNSLIKGFSKLKRKAEALGSGKGKRQEQILSYMSQMGEPVKTVDICQHLHIARSAVNYHLNKLRKSNIVRLKGTATKAVWDLV